MSTKNFSKPKLSKGILEMKFMQRTKAKVDKEIEAAEGRAMYSNEITDKMLNSNSNFIIEPSFVHCDNLIDGRLSFRGMNPEIERLLELELEEKNAAKIQEQSTDVSTQDMAKCFNANKTGAGAGAGHTMEKKFSKYKKVNNKQNKPNNKRQIKEEPVEQDEGAVLNKKTKFIKPKDSDEEE